MCESIVVRPVPRRAAMVGLVSALASVALLACSAVAAADTVTTNFESFNLGSVNNTPQGGWRSAPPGSIPACDPTPTGGAYDQAVVDNPSGTPAAFGARSLRMSNLCASGEFTFQTYSTPVASPAGEDQSNKEYIAQFSFMSKAFQPGLFISVSPDSNEGSRMSWVGLKDTEDGIQVSVSDTPEPDGEFVDHPGPLLTHGAVHTIRFWIKLNPGPNNDLVRIFVDGQDLGQCFTTWENYYRTAPEQAPPPNVNTPADLRNLQFRSSVPGFELTSAGYLFDNVTVTTANGPGPPGCDDVIVKTADQRTVTAGGVEGYRITVRNRGEGSDRNVLACDRIPRGTTFVRANRRLLHLGNRRCLFIPRLRAGQSVSFHLDLRVNANAPPGTLSNIADITPGARPPGAAALTGFDPANLPAAPGKRVAGRIAQGASKPIRRARALARILRQVRPSFTG
ncbi:MAG TPA: hypothetical protein VKB54_08185 [Solirubrobacteraceae bacterium]|nr:hypothetical protein [Solirubrobacteraceae bacterium]